VDCRTSQQWQALRSDSLQCIGKEENKTKVRVANWSGLACVMEKTTFRTNVGLSTSGSKEKIHAI